MQKDEGLNERFGPLGIFTSAWQYRDLILRLTRRDVEARFRGSIFGKVWMVLLPLYLLALYTFVFGVVFQAPWPEDFGGRTLDTALVYFVGIVFVDFLLDCFARAPTLLVENVSYIKKVVFPLHTLSWVVVASALFRLAASGLILLAFYVAIKGLPPISAVALPLLVLPLALLALGIVLVLSALGVYLRDLRQLASVVAPAIMFMSPVFYPMAQVPGPLRMALYVNPLVFVIESARSALFRGFWPNWTIYALYSAIACATAWAGLVWFGKMRRGFADVV